jgi:hypothetical protein
MAGPFTRRPNDDPTNIGEWLAGRGAGRELQGTVPRATPGPPPADDAVAAPQRLEISPQDPRPERLLEADNSVDPAGASPKADPVKPERCLHCNGPLPALRSAAARYCSRKCTRAAAKARKVARCRIMRRKFLQSCDNTSERGEIGMILIMRMIFIDALLL